MNESGHGAARTRLFLGSEAAIGERVELPAGESQHIFKVLRAREGEIVELVTPSRRLTLARVYGDARSAEAEVIEEIPVAESWRHPVTLYQAVPKGKHMDLVVEKATELGAERIVPLLSEHGEVTPSPDKVERWRRIAGSAARQSLQLRVPEITEPTSFLDALGRVSDESGEGASGIVLHNESGIPTLEDAVSAPGATALFVGPEGGWSDGEAALARERGLVLAQMGPYRLRAETAGMVAVARAEARLRSLESEGDGRGIQRDPA